MAIEMAEMKFTVNCCWNKKTGFKDYSKAADVVTKKNSNKVKAAKKSKKGVKVTDVEMEEEPEEELN